MGKFKELALDRLMSEANVALDQIDKVRIPANIIDLERRFINQLTVSGWLIVDRLDKSLILETGTELQIALSECANNARWLDE